MPYGLLYVVLVIVNLPKVLSSFILGVIILADLSLSV